jgi:phage portal protein BeeE
VSRLQEQAAAPSSRARDRLGLDTLRDRRPSPSRRSAGSSPSPSTSTPRPAATPQRGRVPVRRGHRRQRQLVPLEVAGRTARHRRPPGAHLFNKRPNPQMSARVFKYLILHAGRVGRAGVRVAGPRRDRPRRPDRGAPRVRQVDVIVDKPIAQRPTTANIIGFMIRRADGTQVPVLPEEMLWLRYPHPFDPLGCLAPWKAARHAVDMDAYAREWQRSSYANGAMPKGRSTSATWSEQQYTATRCVVALQRCRARRTRARTSSSGRSPARRRGGRQGHRRTPGCP